MPVFPDKPKREMVNPLEAQGADVSGAVQANSEITVNQLIDVLNVMRSAGMGDRPVRPTLVRKDASPVGEVKLTIVGLGRDQEFNLPLMMIFPGTVEEWQNPND